MDAKYMLIIVAFLSVVWLFHYTGCHQIESFIISTNDPVNIVDRRFLSVAIDTSFVRNQWHHIDFTSARLFTLASGLRPAYLRIGGTAADFLIFDKNRKEVCHEEGPENGYDWFLASKTMTNFTITSNDLDKIHQIASMAGWDVVFGLNILLRREDDGSWNSSNPLEIMRYVREKGYNFAWELGNEPNHFGKFNRTITAVQDGKDFDTLRSILDHDPSLGATIAGPDVDRIGQEKAQVYLKQLLASGGNAVDAITWHHYYMDGRTSTAEDFYNVTILDSLVDQLNHVHNIIGTRAPRLKAWIGETSSAWGGGTPGLSDRFAAGFMWLDKLGLAARLHHDLVIRQAFFGGRYALLGLDLLPNPDYWLSLLYKRLVGQEVLEVEKGLEMGRDLRVYAHCTNQQSSAYSSGAITLIALNVNPSKQATFCLKGHLQGLAVDQYLMTPYNDDLTSRLVRLNGNVLQLIDDKTMPILHPHAITSDYMVLPPLTFGFFVVRNATAVACKSTPMNGPYKINAAKP